MHFRPGGWQFTTVMVLLLTALILTGLVIQTHPVATHPSVVRPKPSGTWTTPSTAVPQTLFDVSCAGGGHCVAVGGTILWTSDGGRSWASGKPAGRHNMLRVSCPSPTVCFAANNWGEVIKTVDGGQTWSMLSTLDDISIFDISCATTLNCATANGFQTDNGGISWRHASSLGAVNIECPASNVCYAAAERNTQGAILVNRGDGWSTETVTPRFLDAISCSDADTCLAVGGGAWGTDILRIAKGQTWRVQRLTTKAQTLFDVGCLTIDSCVVVDGTADVLGTTDHGQTWNVQATGLHGYLYGISCSSGDFCIAVGAAPVSVGGGLIARYQPAG